MELYVGGRGQEKLRYVLNRHPELSEEDVFDAAADDISVLHGKNIINHFHMLIKRGTATEVIEEIIEKGNYIIISDEVGSGVIPAVTEEIHYRESTGRCLCRIAERSDHFERVVCGIGQVLK